MATKGIDRRDFLKGTGCMGLAAVAAGCQTDKAVAVVDDAPAAAAPVAREAESKCSGGVTCSRTKFLV